MEQNSMLLVDSAVLPSVYSKVLEAKQLLENGEEKSTADACNKVGISRSAYYKYKDHVFVYEDTAGKIITIHAVLQDKAGNLSRFMSVLYESGANILTVNQNIPSGHRAPVSVSFRTGYLNTTISELFNKLRNLDGVKSIHQVFGE